MSDVVIVALFALIGVACTTMGTIVVAILHIHSGKLDQIHYLVNDRMDKALAEIASLKAQLLTEQTKNGV